MNLNSEIEFYEELRLVDKARLLNLFLHELAEEARATYGAGADQVHDGAHLRFVNELYHRLTRLDRKSTRLNSSHVSISYAVFCLKKKKKKSTGEDQVKVNNT